MGAAYSVGTDAQHPRGIADPARIETHVNDVLLHLGHTAAVAVVKEHTAPATRGVLFYRPRPVLARAASCNPSCLTAISRNRNF
jgi:hypothetical protein